MLTTFTFLARPLRFLIIINGIIFLLLWICRSLDIPLLDYMVLVPSRWAEFWRWLTYAFAHVHPLHFLFNMLMLWMFGNDVAAWLGDKAFVVLYLFSAIFAAGLALPFYLLEWINPQVYILGASGALFGVLVAFARLFPDRVILIFFLFPLPVKYAIWVFILIDLFLVTESTGIAHLVHLGGALAGFLFCYMRNQGWLHNLQGQFSKYRSLRQSGIGFMEEDSPQAKLDAILAKISRSGMASLSMRELQFLQQEGEKRKARRNASVEVPWTRSDN